MTRPENLRFLTASMAAGGTPYTVETMSSAFVFAARYVMSNIENGASPVGPADYHIYDVRPMLDEREHSPYYIDEARAMIRWALDMRVAELPDERQPHLVRIVSLEV